MQRKPPLQQQRRSVSLFPSGVHQVHETHAEDSQQNIFLLVRNGQEGSVLEATHRVNCNSLEMEQKDQVTLPQHHLEVPSID